MRHFIVFALATEYDYDERASIPRAFSLIVSQEGFPSEDELRTKAYERCSVHDRFLGITGITEVSKEDLKFYQI